jgi:MYXO-CTERM domain-containing protein
MRLVLAVLASVLLFSATASGDALPPQRQCPRGKVLQPSHGGGRCVDEAPSCPSDQVALADGAGFSCAPRPPTNCPNGWRGTTDLESGARCVVAECREDACGAGETCTTHPICQEEREVYRFGEAERARSGGLFGAPPVLRKVKVTTGLCPAPGEPTPADFACATCVASKVCLRGSGAPAMTTPPATRPDPVGPVTPPRGGCGSCSSGQGANVLGSAALVATSLAALFVLRRRRRT